MTRVFSHGGLRLFLLMLIEEEPRHGYELIRLVEDRFLGMYTPSAGTVYPRLSALEEEGLVEHEVVDGKKVYRLTPAGRAELDARRSELADLQAQAAESARVLARSIRDEVRHSVRGLRDDLRQAMKDTRRQERYESRQARNAHRRPGREQGGEPDQRGGRLGGHALRADLDAFSDDVLGAAGDVELDRHTLREIRDRLLEAQDAIADLLAARRAATGGGGDAAAPGAQGPGTDEERGDGPTFSL